MVLRTGSTPSGACTDCGGVLEDGECQFCKACEEVGIA